MKSRRVKNLLLDLLPLLAFGGVWLIEAGYEATGAVVMVGSALVVLWRWSVDVSVGEP